MTTQWYRSLSESDKRKVDFFADIPIWLPLAALLTVFGIRQWYCTFKKESK